MSNHIIFDQTTTLMLNLEQRIRTVRASNSPTTQYLKAQRKILDEQFGVICTVLDNLTESDDHETLAFVGESLMQLERLRSMYDNDFPECQGDEDEPELTTTPQLQSPDYVTISIPEFDEEEDLSDLPPPPADWLNFDDEVDSSYPQDTVIDIPDDDEPEAESLPVQPFLNPLDQKTYLSYTCDATEISNVVAKLQVAGLAPAPPAPVPLSSPFQIATDPIATAPPATLENAVEEVVRAIVDEAPTPVSALNALLVDTHVSANKGTRILPTIANYRQVIPDLQRDVPGIRFTVSARKPEQQPDPRSLIEVMALAYEREIELLEDDDFLCFHHAYTSARVQKEGREYSVPCAYVFHSEYSDGTLHIWDPVLESLFKRTLVFDTLLPLSFLDSEEEKVTLSEASQLFARIAQAALTAGVYTPYSQAPVDASPGTRFGVGTYSSALPKSENYLTVADNVTRLCLSRYNGWDDLTVLVSYHNAFPYTYGAAPASKITPKTLPLPAILRDPATKDELVSTHLPIASAKGELRLHGGEAYMLSVSSYDVTIPDVDLEKVFYLASLRTYSLPDAPKIVPVDVMVTLDAAEQTWVKIACCDLPCVFLTCVLVGEFSPPVDYTITALMVFDTPVIHLSRDAAGLFFERQPIIITPQALEATSPVRKLDCNARHFHLTEALRKNPNFASLKAFFPTLSAPSRAWMNFHCVLSAISIKQFFLSAPHSTGHVREEFKKALSTALSLGVVVSGPAFPTSRPSRRRSRAEVSTSARRVFKLCSTMPVKPEASKGTDFSDVLFLFEAALREPSSLSFSNTGLAQLVSQILAFTGPVDVPESWLIDFASRIGTATCLPSVAATDGHAVLYRSDLSLRHALRNHPLPDQRPLTRATAAFAKRAPRLSRR